MKYNVCMLSARPERLTLKVRKAKNPKGQEQGGVRREGAVSPLHKSQRVWGVLLSDVRGTAPRKC